MKKQYIWLFLISTLLISCEDILEQNPQDTTSKYAVFSSETGLNLYSASFYNILPSANNIHTCDMMSDYGARRNRPDFLGGSFDATSEDNSSASGRTVVALGAYMHWGWRELRRVIHHLRK